MATCYFTVRKGSSVFPARTLGRDDETESAIINVYFCLFSTSLYIVIW